MRRRQLQPPPLNSRHHRGAVGLPSRPPPGLHAPLPLGPEAPPTARTAAMAAPDQPEALNLPCATCSQPAKLQCPRWCAAAACRLPTVARRQLVICNEQQWRHTGLLCARMSWLGRDCAAHDICQPVWRRGHSSAARPLPPPCRHRPPPPACPQPGAGAGEGPGRLLLPGVLQVQLDGAQAAAQAQRDRGLALLHAPRRRPLPRHARVQVDWRPAPRAHRPHAPGAGVRVCVCWWWRPRVAATHGGGRAAGGGAAVVQRRRVCSMFPPRPTPRPPRTCLQIPDHIPKPDYYLTGFPTSEVESRQQHAGTWRAAMLHAASRGGRAAVCASSPPLPSPSHAPAAHLRRLPPVAQSRSALRRTLPASARRAASGARYWTRRRRRCGRA